MAKLLPITSVLLLFCLFASFSNINAADNDWLIGKWRLAYDPDGAPTDYLVFKANGDMINISVHGETHGFYIVGNGMVKGVLTTVSGQDLIVTFFYNQEKTQLRIVTSDSGIESVYEKMNQE